MLTFNTKEEFLNSRKGKIGASDAPIIMGVSPFKTPYQLWREKLGLTQNNETSPAMQRGIDLESSAREAFIKMTGIDVNPGQVLHPDFNWMIASLDGIDAERKNIVEIKCPGEKDHELAKKGIIPEKYRPQLQHQLLCTTLSEMFYFSFDGQNGVIIKEKRDDCYIKNLIIMEMNFLVCLKELTPPELSDKDFTINTSKEWRMASEEYLECQKQINKLEKDVEFIKEKLIQLSQGRNCKGNGISVNKVIRKGNLNYKLIPELEGIDLEKYRNKPTEYYKISLS